MLGVLDTNSHFSACFEKDDKYVFKARNFVGGIVCLWERIVCHYRNKSDDYLYVYIRNC